MANILPSPRLSPKKPTEVDSELLGQYSREVNASYKLSGIIPSIETGEKEEEESSMGEDEL